MKRRRPPVGRRLFSTKQDMVLDGAFGLDYEERRQSGHPGDNAPPGEFAGSEDIELLSTSKKQVSA